MNMTYRDRIKGKTPVLDTTSWRKATRLANFIDRTYGLGYHTSRENVRHAKRASRVARVIARARQVTAAYDVNPFCEGGR